jgi:hypothetical protein
MMRRRTETIHAQTKFAAPFRHLVAGRTTTTIPQQLGSVRLTTTTDDGRSFPIFRCAVSECKRLYWTEDAAQRCCEKHPLCGQCGPKTGNLCRFQSDFLCTWCKERREWRDWLRSKEEAGETGQLFWSDDSYGDVEDFWEAVSQLAWDSDDEEEDNQPSWRHFYNAFEALRPYNTVPWRLDFPGDVEDFSERFLRWDDVARDFDPPEEILTALRQAHELLTAAADKYPLGFIAGNTRPAGLLEELPDRAAEFVAEWARDHG